MTARETNNRGHRVLPLGTLNTFRSSQVCRPLQNFHNHEFYAGNISSCRARLHFRRSLSLRSTSRWSGGLNSFYGQHSTPEFSPEAKTLMVATGRNTPALRGGVGGDKPSRLAIWLARAKSRRRDSKHFIRSGECGASVTMFWRAVGANQGSAA